MSTEERPNNEAEADDHGSADHEIVERRAALLAMRIESHTLSIPCKRPRPARVRSSGRW